MRRGFPGRANDLLRAGFAAGGAQQARMHQRGGREGGIVLPGVARAFERLSRVRLGLGGGGGEGDAIGTAIGEQQRLPPIAGAHGECGAFLAQPLYARPNRLGAPRQRGGLLKILPRDRLAKQAAQADEGGILALGQRMWAEIASLVTVRAGDRVVVGAPASVVLDAARERVEAGDLAGAVAALVALDPAAAAVMADWKARVQSLLDARAALAKLAQG